MKKTGILRLLNFFRLPKMKCIKIVGYISIIITYLSFGVGLYFFVYQLAFRWAQTNYLLYYPTIDVSVRIGMAMWSHLSASLGDPGFVLPNINDDSESKDICKKCSAKRPSRTHHCSACNHCVEQMDHHCPWINNCVGVKNRKAFLLFLAYTCSAAIECLILVVVRMATCRSISEAVMLMLLRLALGTEAVDQLLAKGSDEDSKYIQTEPTCNLTLDYTIAGIIGTLLAFLFTIFIALIASDQIYAILHNQNHVETLKGMKGPQRTAREAIIETFGMEPSMWWLVPVDWRFKPLLVEKKIK